MTVGQRSFNQSTAPPQTQFLQLCWVTGCAAGAVWRMCQDDCLCFHAEINTSSSVEAELCFRINEIVQAPALLTPESHSWSSCNCLWFLFLNTGAPSHWLTSCGCVISWKRQPVCRRWVLLPWVLFKSSLKGLQCRGQFTWFHRASNRTLSIFYLASFTTHYQASLCFTTLSCDFTCLVLI